MNGRKNPENRCPATATPPAGENAPGSSTMGWESRALARVRPHVRELSGPGAAQAGWETDTVTRLEDYFDRDQV